MRKADILPPYRAVVMKSRSLNFLQPSGPAQTCYGRALRFLLLKNFLSKATSHLATSLFIVEDPAPYVATGLINVLEIFIFYAPKY